MRRTACLILALLATPVPACPVCESDTGREVRARIFDGDFAANLLAVLAPFPAVLLAVAAIRGRPTPSESQS